MLSYMKCGKTECEKPRLLESVFCSEHQRESLVEALEFSYGAILDAIACEDGLDGAAGAAVMSMIEKALGYKPVTAAQHLKGEQGPAVQAERSGEMGYKGICSYCERAVFVKVGERWCSKGDKVWHLACSKPCAAQPPQELVSLREACIQSLAEHEAIYEVMLLEPRNKGMLPPAIIAKLRAALTRGAVRK